MLACALARLARATPPTVLAKLETAFGLTAKAWTEFLAGADYSCVKNIEKLKRRCRPRVGATEAVAYIDAVRKGGTSRAQHVADYIRNADSLLERAQDALEEFGSTGDDAALERFIRAVTGSGITEISRSFLFSALGHDSFLRAHVPPERLIRLLSCHPIMDRRHLGTLLDLRFRFGQPLSAENILTGLFQSLGRLPIQNGTGAGLHDVADLAACREWARVRLDQWLREKATGRVEEVAAVWRDGRARPAPHPFCSGVVCLPESPRNMREWEELMREALEWLRARWRREIGSSRWVMENQLFQIMRRRLKGIEVIQHARPTWIEPQHLDVWVPEAGMAVEYMGRQHFEPLGYFGGESAFREIVVRDRKKAELCRENGVELIRIRFDEDSPAPR